MHRGALLWGAARPQNGVGKSRLIQSLVERLPQKTYRTLVLSYSSLTGTDVMRYLCHLHGLNLAQRRSDNLMALRTMWGMILLFVFSNLLRDKGVLFVLTN